MTIKIYGGLLDQASRCRHYHTVLDIVALKCFACRNYYACYKCHDSLEAHPYQAYPDNRVADKVVICGVCKEEMTIAEYRSSKTCPNCQSAFNPACGKHDAIYFS